MSITSSPRIRPTDDAINLVMPAQGEQLVVRALLDDAPGLEDDQTVHARDGGKAVRDRDHRLALHQVESCSWIASSTSLSSAEVASSSTRIGASFRMTRASATRWRWPPESFTPRSPTWAA